MKLPLLNDQQLRELMDRSFRSYRKPDHAKEACDSVLTRLKQSGTCNAEDPPTTRKTTRRGVLEGPQSRPLAGGEGSLAGPGFSEEKPEAAWDSVRQVRRTWRWQWAAVAAAALAIVMTVILPTRILQGAPAVLEDADGKRSIQYGELVRPAGDMSAMLSMADGPRIETRSMSEFSLEPTDDGGTRIRLKEGGLIVDASAENRTNLYVQTKDITALVSGAMSLVKAEEVGSRIAVIAGEIRVRQGTAEKTLRPGEQVATSPAMELVSMTEEVAWSRQAAAHVAMLQQSASTIPPVPPGPFKFAAASVRLWGRVLDDAGRPTGVQFGVTTIKCLGADGLLAAPPGLLDIPARRGRCTAQAVPVANLLVAAYSSSSLNVVVGFNFPSNPLPPMVQIEAVADDPERVTKGELQQMLQNLLADRFKARVHVETREVDGYALTIAKSGIKFKPTPAEATPAVCRNFPNSFSLSGSCTLQALASRVEASIAWGAGAGPEMPRVPVSDKTGLVGSYDINFLQEDPRRSQGGGAAVRGPGGGDQNPGPPPQFSPPIPKAVEDQLGLHLEPAKVSVQFIVIDHLELPTEN